MLWGCSQDLFIMFSVCSHDNLRILRWLGRAWLVLWVWRVFRFYGSCESDWLGVSGGLVGGCGSGWAVGSWLSRWSCWSRWPYGFFGSSGFDESDWLGGSGWSEVPHLANFGYFVAVRSLMIQRNSMIPKSSMIQKEFQLKVFALIAQKSTVIPPSSMLFFVWIGLCVLCFWYFVLYFSVPLWGICSQYSPLGLSSCSPFCPCVGKMTKYPYLNAIQVMIQEKIIK